MSGLFRNGVDLDSLFELRVSGEPQRANVGIRNAGADIAERYLPSSAGSPAAPIGIRSGGVDIGPLFCAKDGRQFRATMTRGAWSTYSTGYSNSAVDYGAFGSLSPNHFKGVRVDAVVTTDLWQVNLMLAQAELPRGFVGSLHCSLGVFSAAAAPHHYSRSGATFWVWDVPPQTWFPSTGSETITITG